jgi:hypothetical protein
MTCSSHPEASKDPEESKGASIANAMTCSSHPEESKDPEESKGDLIADEAIAIIPSK